MQRRKVERIVPAQNDDVADLLTFRALPVPGLQDLNPFIFLNHHGPQNFSENNPGLPFGPHPHRGFETVTFILAGDIAHQDSSGSSNVVLEGGVQWMTAGRGIVHSEVSSDHFRRAGGPLEILQLWVNLPARLKMTEPYYLGLQKHQIPVFQRDSGKIKIQLVAGKWEDHLGPFPPIHPVTSMLVAMDPGSAYSFMIERERIFFYVVSGSLTVNGTRAEARETVLFSDDGEMIEVESETGSRILLCHAPPLNEPIASYGPFVMNTKDEILDAIRDYQSGKFV